MDNEGKTSVYNIEKTKNRRRWSHRKNAILAGVCGVMALVFATGATYAWFTNAQAVAGELGMGRVGIFWDEAADATPDNKYALFTFVSAVHTQKEEFEDAFEDDGDVKNPGVFCEIVDSAFQGALTGNIAWSLDSDDFTIFKGDSPITPGSIIFSKATFYNISDVPVYFRVTLPSDIDMGNFKLAYFLRALPSLTATEAEQKALDEDSTLMGTALSDRTLQILQDSTYEIKLQDDGAYYCTAPVYPTDYSQIKFAVGVYVSGVHNNAAMIDSEEDNLPDYELMNQTINVSGVVVETIQCTEDALIDKEALTEIWGSDGWTNVTP